MVCIPSHLTPPSQIDGILRDTVNKRAVHILLECILVSIIVENLNGDIDSVNGPLMTARGISQREVIDLSPSIIHLCH